jgi:Fe2+ or Zn2+ uptake regulation protein
MADKSIILSLIDPKISKILSTLVNNPKAFYLKELADLSDVPTASTYRILLKLEKLNIIQVMKISKFKLYTLSSNKDTKFLQNLFLEKQNALENFISRVKKDPSIESVLLHGDTEDDKANLIIIGEKLDSEFLDGISEEILNESGFQISFVTIDDAQFKKMTSMGLYSGKKRLLYSK